MLFLRWFFNLFKVENNFSRVVVDVRNLEHTLVNNT